jgi:hypothetical protein
MTGKMRSPTLSLAHREHLLRSQPSPISTQCCERRIRDEHEDSGGQALRKDDGSAVATYLPDWSMSSTFPVVTMIEVRRRT